MPPLARAKRRYRQVGQKALHFDSRVSTSRQTKSRRLRQARQADSTVHNKLTSYSGPQPAKTKHQTKPVAIIANTIKGKGVSFMENQAGWHGKAPNDEQLEIALKDLA